MCVDEPWVIKRIDDGKRQMCSARFHSPKGHRNAHQFRNLPQRRSAFNKSSGLRNEVESPVTGIKLEYGQV
jgi:hypothetical protein